MNLSIKSVSHQDFVNHGIGMTRNYAFGVMTQTITGAVDPAIQVPKPNKATSIICQQFLLSCNLLQ